MNNLSDKRIFFVGSEWIYFKIYTGEYFADRIIEEIAKSCMSLLKHNIIYKWFFIRYWDPDFHLRVRLHINDMSAYAFILKEIQDSLKDFISNEIITKTQLDSYIRELERYGGKHGIVYAENLFYIDSITTISFLNLINSNVLSEDYRWLFGICSIDSLMTDFGLSLKDKYDFMDFLKKKIDTEFEKNKNLNKQLEEKFQEVSKQMESVINEKQMQSFNELFLARSKYLEKDISRLISDINEGLVLNSQFNLLSSFIHMLCNRLFRFDPRKHEFVLYDLLSRYYKREFYRKRMTII